MAYCSLKPKLKMCSGAKFFYCLECESQLQVYVRWDILSLSISKLGHRFCHFPAWTTEIYWNWIIWGLQMAGLKLSRVSQPRFAHLSFSSFPSYGFKDFLCQEHLGCRKGASAECHVSRLLRRKGWISLTSSSSNELCKAIAQSITFSNLSKARNIPHQNI